MERKEATNKALELAGFEASEVFSRIGQAERFLKAQPLFYDKNGLWWIWDKEKYAWIIVDEVDILNAIKNNLNIDIINSKSRNEIINSLKQVGRENIPEKIKPTWIQFKDKIIDIATGEEFKSTPKYFITNPIPYAIHENKFEETPTMDKIFTEWVGEEYVETLYEIIAYCLIPNYPIHRLFCFIGNGMNGKSCFLRLLIKFVGESNVTSTELDTLLNSRFEVTRLHKKLVCVMGETNFNEMNKTSILKKLTGQDVIGFEYKNKNPFEDLNYAKILIATNNLPTTTDKTVGFYRRWLIIDFPNQFDEKKDILSEIPEEEYRSLALKCVHKLHGLLKTKKFTKEGDISDRINRYEQRSDFLQKFVNDFIITKVDGYITKAELQKKFNEWCVENRHRNMSDKTLSQKMREKGYYDGKKYFSWLYDGKGGDARIWQNISWK